ncbi:MAG: GNAT family N-acetyltransferase [Candidatus Sericytochromatia bacterium]|nr:GNAT family N-acetyltransferase [Candidatus Sericytochromatia bacterium]
MPTEQVDFQIKLREFVIGDIPAIAAIRNASIEISPDFYSMTVDRFRYDFYGADTPLTSRIVVAEVKNKAAGFYHLYTDEHLLARGRSNLDAIHVVEDVRGQGVGAALVKSALETAKNWGATYVSTAVPESSPRSLEFLERHGFDRARRFDMLRLPITSPVAPPPPPNNFTLRTFQAGDEAAFVTAFNAAFADHWDFIPLKAPEIQEWNQRAAFDPAGCFLLIDNDTKKVAAFCTVLHHADSAQSGTKPIGRIFEMGVVPELRRQGLGYLVLQAGLSYASEHGFEAIDLITDSQSDAGQKLYAKVGFTERRASIVLHHPL